MIEVVVTDNKGEKESFAIAVESKRKILQDIHDFMSRDNMVLHLITKNKDTFLKSENIRKIEVL